MAKNPKKNHEPRGSQNGQGEPPRLFTRRLLLIPPLRRNAPRQLTGMGQIAASVTSIYRAGKPSLTGCKSRDERWRPR